MSKRNLKLFALFGIVLATAGSIAQAISTSAYPAIPIIIGAIIFSLSLFFIVRSLLWSQLTRERQIKQKLESLSSEIKSLARSDDIGNLHQSIDLPSNHGGEPSLTNLLEPLSATIRNRRILIISAGDLGDRALASVKNQTAAAIDYVNLDLIEPNYTVTHISQYDTIAIWLPHYEKYLQGPRPLLPASWICEQARIFCGPPAFLRSGELVNLFTGTPVTPVIDKSTNDGAEMGLFRDLSERQS